jgi:hypothetical protein
VPAARPRSSARAGRTPPLSSLECPGQTPPPFSFFPGSRLLCLAALSPCHFPFSPPNSFRRARLHVAGILYCHAPATVLVVAIHLTSPEPSSSEQHAPRELHKDCCVGLVVEDARTRQPHPERRHAGHLEAAAIGACSIRVHCLIELPLPCRAEHFLLQTTTSRRSAPPPSPRRVAAPSRLPVSPPPFLSFSAMVQHSAGARPWRWPKFGPAKKRTSCLLLYLSILHF